MDKPAAEKLSILMMQLNARLNESIAFVRDFDTEENFEDHRRVAAEVMTSLHIDVTQKLWKRFPELKPIEFGGAYVVDPKVFDPPFYEWNDAQST